MVRGKYSTEKRSAHKLTFLFWSLTNADKLCHLNAGIYPIWRSGQQCLVVCGGGGGAINDTYTAVLSQKAVIAYYYTK